MTVEQTTAAPQMAPPPLIETRAVSKRYPGVLALDEVDFELRAGEAHVLFGENGAGKSTLISMLSPAHKASRCSGDAAFSHGTGDRDRLGARTPASWASAPCSRSSPSVPQLTVEENLFLGDGDHPPTACSARSELHARAQFASSTASEFPLKPSSAGACTSTRAEQQMVEIAKAFRADLSKMLILDEPTASLTERETEQLFALVQQAHGAGRGRRLHHPPDERDPPASATASPCCATAATSPPSAPRRRHDEELVRADDRPGDRSRSSRHIDFASGRGAPAGRRA